MVWNGGVGYPMKYNDDIIFSTTLTYGDNVEDNRLCGLDAKTGEIKWLFPADREQTYNYFFNGPGYLYNDNLLVKSPPLGDKRPNDELLCIDLKTSELKYSYDCPGKDGEASWNCFGYSKYVVWDENMKREAKIYLMDIETGNAEPIVSLTHAIDYEVDLDVIGFSEGRLIYTEKEYNSDMHGNYICKYDIKANELVYRHEVELYEGYGFYGNCSDNNTIYAISGPYIMAIDTDSGDTLWSVDINELPNYWLRSVVVCGDKLFAEGHNMHMALDKTSGKILYKKKVAGCWWAVEHKGNIYLNIDENILVLDVNTGEILATLVCPEKMINGDGFNATLLPSFYDDKLYIMSYTTAYCYPAYPW
jgi:outer membrane protein assembly factor BamB